MFIFFCFLYSKCFLLSVFELYLLSCIHPNLLQLNNMQTRKQFLKNSLCIATGSTLFGIKRKDDFMKTRVISSYLSFDLHCHPGRLFAHEGIDFGGVADAAKTINEMKTANLSGAFFTLVADSKLLIPGPTGISISGKWSVKIISKFFKFRISSSTSIVFITIIFLKVIKNFNIKILCTHSILFKNFMLFL